MDTRALLSTGLAAIFGLVQLMQGPQPKDGPSKDYYADTNPFNETTQLAPVDEAVQLTAVRSGDEVLSEVETVLDEIRAERKEFQAQVDSLKEVIERVGAPGSFKVPTDGTCECNCLSKDELRTVIREELEEHFTVEGLEGATFNVVDFLAEVAKHAAGVKGTKDKKESAVAEGVSTTTETVTEQSVASYAVMSPAPVASTISYGTAIYSSGGGGSTGGSTTYSAPIYYPVQSYQSGGSTGGSSSYATPTYSTSPTTRTVTRNRLLGGTVTRTYNATPRTYGSSRYFVNEYGCTVDRQTGKVVSCPVNKR